MRGGGGDILLADSRFDAIFRPLFPSRGRVLTVALSAFEIWQELNNFIKKAGDGLQNMAGAALSIFRRHSVQSRTCSRLVGTMCLE
jgi:hypothetical protein